MGLRSKRHVFSTGRIQGGNPFSRGQIYSLLRNPVYLGLIRHKDKTWPGKHAAILDQDIWDQVQAGLQHASGRPRGKLAVRDHTGATIKAAPLLGKFRDETGDILTPTHTLRHGRRLRYYVSNRLISGGVDPSGWRLPAPGFEKAVAKVISDHLTKFAKRHGVLRTIAIVEVEGTSQKVGDLATRIGSTAGRLLAKIIVSGQISEERVCIKLNAITLSDALGHPVAGLSLEFLEIDAPFTCRRHGVEAKVIAGDPAPLPDKTLIHALRNAYNWAEMLRSGPPINAIATTHGFSNSYVARIIPLAGLSPRIQTAIMDDDQPAELTLESLVRAKLPLGWQAQERLFGFI